MLLLATLSLILLLSSCAGKGFNRLEMTKDLTYPNSDHSLDKDIAALLDKRPELHSPFKLALVFAGDYGF